MMLAVVHSLSVDKWYAEPGPLVPAPTADDAQTSEVQCEGGNKTFSEL